MSEPTVLLKAEQVSERLQIPSETLKYWRAKGTGPRVLRMGRHVRYSEADVEAWLEQQRHTAA